MYLRSYIYIYSFLILYLAGVSCIRGWTITPTTVKVFFLVCPQPRPEAAIRNKAGPVTSAHTRLAFSLNWDAPPTARPDCWLSYHKVPAATANYSSRFDVKPGRRYGSTQSPGQATLFGNEPAYNMTWNTESTGESRKRGPRKHSAKSTPLKACYM